MSFQEKNVAVTLANFTLILLFFLFRVVQMVLTDSFTSANVFRLWVIVIAMAVFVTIAATILTHIVIAIIEAIVTGQEEPEISDVTDERDRMIDLRGTRVTYSFYSVGVFLAMLTFVLGQPPLVMFTSLIFFSVLAQIIGDIWRFVLYRRGF